MKPLAIFLYWAVSIVHLLACLGIDIGGPHGHVFFAWTKPLLMPLLMLVLYVGARPRPADLPIGAVQAGLFASFLGDVLLMFSGTAAFLGGMGAFGLAHVCYIYAWSRAYSLRTPFARHEAVFVLPLFVYVYVAYSLIHPNLSPAMRPAILGYMALLVGDCFAAFLRRLAVPAPSGTAIFVGAFLFVQSDSLIALHEFRATFPDGTRAPGLPLVQLMIMATYVIGQWLIVRGCMARAGERQG